MTLVVQKKIKALNRNIRVNTQAVKSGLEKSGLKSDQAVVSSAAKYYATLKRLAQE